MTTFFFEIDEKDVEETLHRLQLKLSPVLLSPWMLGYLEPYFSKRALERFHSEGDAASGPWAALAQTTVERRLEAGFGGAHPINYRTGELEDYITSADGNTDVEGEGAVVFTYPGNPPEDQDIYAKLTGAQQGIGPNNERFPPRPVLAVGEMDAIDVTLGLVDFMFGAGEVGI